VTRGAIDEAAPPMEIEPLGELALRIAIPAGVDRRALLDRLRAMPGVADAVVTETHALVRFDAPPVALDPDALRDLGSSEGAVREHVIAVRYDGEDLDEIATLAGIGRGEVIARHAASIYVVSFVGFLPGFAYLRGLDPLLAGIPRRASPRTRVPAGAVAIGGGFTGIYPFESPGGWRLLGRAPEHAALEGGRAVLAVGDRVRFVEVA
jgi:UPF0271 protein